MQTNTSLESANNVEVAEESKSLMTTDKLSWKQQPSESKENIDIHQLLAITIVRMADNDNNDTNDNNQRSPVIYPKKRQSSSPVESPMEKQLNNLLVSKNDEDLQNMLNGNISEVSTDTKSFKEKLIMFEKLGK